MLYGTFNVPIKIQDADCWSHFCFVQASPGHKRGEVEMVTATRTASCGCTYCRAVVMEMRTNENGYTFMQTFSRAPDASVTTYPSPAWGAVYCPPIFEASVDDGGE